MAGRKCVCQIWLYVVLVSEPVPFDVVILQRSPNSDVIVETITKSLTRGGFLTEEEFTRHIAIVASDHAASMLSAIRKLGVAAAGDAPHAVELVIKAVVKKLGIQPLLVQLRKVFAVGHSTARARLLELFRIPAGMFSM